MLKEELVVSDEQSEKEEEGAVGGDMKKKPTVKALRANHRKSTDDNGSDVIWIFVQRQSIQRRDAHDDDDDAEVRGKTPTR